MSERKFLTVMAVFDGETQLKLGEIQRHIMENVAQGTQTMGIPFHLTLGSYPVEELDGVIERIKSVAGSTKCFNIKLLGYSHFDNRVLFLEPETSVELLRLRKSFECDYANGFEWVPHATVFCGNDEDVARAKKIAPLTDLPIEASIVGIELGEFFPPDKKFSIDFLK